jgi:hypothetical protein
MLCMEMRPPESLDTLPNEILLNITEHFDCRQNRHRILYVLSRVNHRLRNFAQPFLLLRVAAARKDLFFMSHFFREANGDYARFVRFVSRPVILDSPFNYPSQIPSDRLRCILQSKQT